MAKSRKKSSQGSILESLLKWKSDDRLTKILAMLCFMLAIFLSISFTSYLFSWKSDQDKVMHYSWHILFKSGISVENWLGRLGAFVSHMFFYYGFGLAGYLFIPVLIHLGFRFLYRNEWIQFLRFFTHSVVITALLSMILSFVGQWSNFPMGGSFGHNSCRLLSSFVGDIGLGISLIFGLISLFVWYFNPSLQALQLQTSGSSSLSSFWSPNWLSFKSEKSAGSDKSDMAKSMSVHTSMDTKEDSVDGPVDFSDYHAEKLGFVHSTGDTHELTNFINEIPSSTGAASKILALEINDTPLTSTSDQDTEQNVPMASESSVLQEEDGWSSDSMEPYDPTLDLRSFKMPGLELLQDYSDQKNEVDRSELEANSNQIIATLQHYKIEIQKIKVTIGPTVTLYEIVPAPGVRISRIKSLEDDIALSLSAQGIRIIAPIPGRGTIGIEVANKNKQIVPLKELLKSERFNDTKLELPLALGKNISNEVVVADLTKMPHLLIAGATGQGKSVGINSILMSLLYRKHPSEVKLVLIDPKKVELPIYSEIYKHYLAQLPNSDEAIITDTSKVIYTLNSLCIEMDQRYELLKAARVRNLLEYNEKFKNRKLNPEKGHKFLPYIVLIIDEFADLIMTAGKEVELPIGRLAQLARAVGIHLIIATQRPSVKIITGLIKANFPGRIAFKVSSNIDSRTILDYGGAERLIGRGDLLYSVGSDIIRLQCAFVDTPEVERVIKHISNQQGYASPYFLPEYKGENQDDQEGGNLSAGDMDDMLEEAARLVVQSQHGSTSMIQRRLKLGYNRAGRIMDQMESLGIVSSAEGSKPREVLVFNEIELDKILSKYK